MAVIWCPVAALFGGVVVASQTQDLVVGVIAGIAGLVVGFVAAAVIPGVTDLLWGSLPAPESTDFGDAPKTGRGLMVRRKVGVLLRHRRCLLSALCLGCVPWRPRRRTCCDHHRWVPGTASIAGSSSSLGQRPRLQQAEYEARPARGGPLHVSASPQPHHNPVVADIHDAPTHPCGQAISKGVGSAAPPAWSRQPQAGDSSQAHDGY